VADEDGSERPNRRAMHHSPHYFHRAVLLICAVAISIPVVYKSRPARETSSGTAFSHLSSSYGFVCVSGDVRHAGMYPLSANMLTVTAIKMADPVLSSLDGLSVCDAAAPLVNGMALHVSARPDGTVLLTKSYMAVNERIVMGIPLDINIMNESDFDDVPGIGPVLAKRIVAYRQKNGGIMATADLLAVEGIGNTKYNRLLKYFNRL